MWKTTQKVIAYKLFTVVWALFYWFAADVWELYTRFHWFAFDFGPSGLWEVLGDDEASDVGYGATIIVCIYIVDWS